MHVMESDIDDGFAFRFDQIEHLLFSDGIQASISDEAFTFEEGAKEYGENTF